MQLLPFSESLIVPVERQAFMVEHIKAMLPEMMKKHMAMMQSHLQMMREEMGRMRDHMGTQTPNR